MFVIRSAFWLAIGFAIVAPHGTDFGVVASQAKDQAIGAGTQAAEQLIVGQVLNTGAVARIAADTLTSTKTIAVPVQVSAVASFVFPRPRPAALG